LGFCYFSFICYF